ncbi:hypothetical protein P170DRAFT_467173 [Aspergillus steynii IBT 23096]|uniref:NACHT domain-containing protein n=1 Tax=Aspergillus steynii IBT 23096 TaxID=1392250 RepID=A0A2I2FZE2_9EURO|nr:uncharacterized protein P170DRAFT_467173 [Aspergillus steynii IBT 23096]PLB45998.1 hypothetical protein P170DRAFT_467173 [Aspergillus steynii IBT 23096]
MLFGRCLLELPQHGVTQEGRLPRHLVWPEEERPSHSKGEKHPKQLQHAFNRRSDDIVADTREDTHETNDRNPSNPTSVDDGDDGIQPVVSITQQPNQHQDAQLGLIHATLWKNAYDNLKTDPEKEKYVRKYEELLVNYLTKSSSNTFGEKQMEEIVAGGLEKIDKYKKIIVRSDSTIRVIKQIKEILGIPLKNIPQTTLPWAVISSTVDILLKPVEVGANIYNGVASVVSKMEWYSKYTDHLLRDDKIRINEKDPLKGIRDDIAGNITSLYQSLLYYQIRSVCFYFKKHQPLVLLRGIVDLDNWSGDLQSIEEAEQVLTKTISLYNDEHLKNRLKDLEHQMIDWRMDIETENEFKKFQHRLQAIRRVDPEATVKGIQSLKEESMSELYAWIFKTDQFKAFVNWEDENATRRLWISGQAGTGKTMLLIGAIEELQSRTLLESQRLRTELPIIIYFFCQYTHVDLNNGVAVLQSLVWMLLRKQPKLMSHLDEQFSHSGDKFIQDPYSFATWRDILINMLKDTGRVFLVIDALDECEKTTRAQLVKFLNDELWNKELSRVKCLITSRPLSEIPESTSETAVRNHSLLRLDDEDLSPSIDKYIEEKMRRLQKDKDVNGQEQKEVVQSIVGRLRDRASNTFIWVSLVCEQFKDEPLVLWGEVMDQIPSGLDEMYDYLLGRLKRQIYRDILAMTMLARRPLTLRKDCVIQCRSFLAIRGETVYLIHQSAQDWLSENHRRLSDVPLQELHGFVFQNSLNGMSEILKENIYGLSHCGVLSDEVTAPADNPLSPVRYACQYWAYHLEESDVLPATDILHFLQDHILHWLEAMALMGLMPETIGVVDMLQSLPGVRENSDLSEFLYDAKRFILTNSPAVGIAPLQLYVSALLFTPEASIVRRTREIPNWILKPPVVEKEWGSLLQTLEHSSAVNDVAFSPDNQLIAGADDDLIKIWDTATGDLERELKPEPRSLFGFRSVAFSSDGRMLVTGSSDGSVLLWDTDSWQETQILLHEARV